MSGKCRNIKAPSGKVYSYDSIAGIPVAEYIRLDARKRYIPHPRTKTTELSAEATKHVYELRAQGHSHAAIAKMLNTSRYRIQRLLGTALTTTG